MSRKTANEKVRIRGVALPNEHGSWGILGEPLLVAIAVAPSINGMAVMLVFVGAFLARQPLKVFLADRFAGRDLPRTRAALNYLCLFSATCFLGIAGVTAFGHPDNYVAAALIVPFGVYQVYSDVGQKSRQLIPEMIGTLAISSSALFIALAGGWTAATAVSLWGIMCARLIPSVIYVRNRLRLEKGKPYSVAAVMITNVAALLTVSVLSIYGFAPYLTVIVFALLLARSAFGLSPVRKRAKAMEIGIWEVVFGLLTVLSVIVGYYLDI